MDRKWISFIRKLFTGKRLYFCCFFLSSKNCLDPVQVFNNARIKQTTKLWSLIKVEKYQVTSLAKKTCEFGLLSSSTNTFTIIFDLQNIKRFTIFFYFLWNTSFLGEWKMSEFNFRTFLTCLATGGMHSHFHFRPDYSLGWI